MHSTDYKTMIDAIIEQVSMAVAGKHHEIRMVLSGFLSGGHILLEDIPGVGKTTLAKALAHALGPEYRRIQFTSDLLPSDILGVSYFDTSKNSFVFQHGSVFTQFLLADEINRTTPKTQSALLEAMEEHQISIEGKTRKLPEPFFVIATQNPFEEEGTFPLPASQLDRFSLSLSLGYPDTLSEREVIKGKHIAPQSLVEAVDMEQIMALKEAVARVNLSEAILDYIQKLVAFTRESGLFVRGLSTRGVLALAQSAKAWAVTEGRDYVIPEDVQAVLAGVVGHRLRLASGERVGREIIANRIIEAVAIDE